MELEAHSNKYFFAFKRATDILFSFLLLLITSPIILLFLILIPINSPGKAIYSQERVGLNGKKFLVFKLRSMRNDAEKNGPQWASQEDNRVTSIGKFIRKTRIDELPQLFNVLKGDMSLIGPRPERQVFIEEFIEVLPDFTKRLAVKPGLSGYAQVTGGYDLSPKEKLEKDLYYIQNISLKMDIYIFFKTIYVVFSGDGAR